MKKRANAHAVNIGIAIRQRHDGVALLPKRQGGQRVLKQIHLLPFGKKDLKSGFGQMRRITRLQQQRPNRLEAKK